MDEDWKPPPLAELVGSWTVESWLSSNYQRYESRKSAIMRAAALGLIHAHFRPSGSEKERSRYYQVSRIDPLKDVRQQAWFAARNSPISFRRTLAREIVAEARRLRDWLNRIEGEANPPHEIEAYISARHLIERALLPLIASQRVARVRRVLKRLDAEAAKRGIKAV